MTAPMDTYVTVSYLNALLDHNGCVRGTDGCDGEKGDRGEKGDKGDRGATGPKGEKGCKGDRGEQGQRGEPGLDGKNGCDGQPGRDGRDGRQGDKGEMGATGQPGKDGKDGQDGCCGEEGLQGDQGEKGDKGDQGEKGEQGDQGEKGEKGDTGEQGIQGEKGEKGEQGEKGDKGDTGPTGPTGPAGLDGTDGSAGAMGVPGADGTSPTIDCAQPTDSSLVLTINNNDGTAPTVKTLDVGAGGSTGLDSAQVTALIEDLRCCNVEVNRTNNTDGSITYAIVQTQGADVTFTVPAGQGTQGPAGADGQDGSDGVDGISLDGTTTCNVVNPNTDQAFLELSFGMTDGNTTQVNIPGDKMWSLISSFAPQGTNTVTWVSEVDPDNPCRTRTVFSAPGQANCEVETYDPQAQSCACRCITVTAGTTITVTGTSEDGFSVAWDENDQVSQVAGGEAQAGVYTYNTAGTYELKVCLNSYCDTLEDWSITSPTSFTMDVCNNCG